VRDQSERTAGERSELDKCESSLAGTQQREDLPARKRLVISTNNAIVGEHGDALDQVRATEGVRPGTYSVLSVSDNGCGMSEEVKKHIFEPFFTTKPIGQGTGLGLATVYGIVKQSQGHIVVDSTPGQGTTMHVYLPTIEEPADSPNAEVQAKVVRGGGETVLVVEDEEGVRSLACHALREKGYRVLSAANGEEALFLFQRYPHPIHLLLTDVIMPRLNGHSLVQRVRSNWPETRCLFMSGFPAGNGHEPSDEWVCLPKPFLPEELSRSVRQVLDEPLRARAIATMPAAEQTAWAGRERRSTPRRTPTNLVRIGWNKGRFSSDPNVRSLVDLSVEGAGLIFQTSSESCPVEIGQEMVLVLSEPGLDAPLEVAARVVWAVPLARGSCRVGLRFHRRLSQHEWQQLTRKE
jgi:CheY-like chemotaxis protein